MLGKKILITSNPNDEVNSRLTSMGYVVTSLIFGFYSSYDPTRDNLRRLKELAESGEFDGYVLANNLGAGEVLADGIPIELRCRTVVVWSDDPLEVPQDNESLYRGKGYEHLTSRYHAPEVLDRILA